MSETKTYETFLVGKVNELNGLALSADRLSRFANFEITALDDETIYVVEQEEQKVYVGIKNS
jgi:hypothetical protein